MTSHGSLFFLFVVLSSTSNINSHWRGLTGILSVSEGRREGRAYSALFSGFCCCLVCFLFCFFVSFSFFFVFVPHADAVEEEVVEKRGSDFILWFALKLETLAIYFEYYSPLAFFLSENSLYISLPF